MAGTENNNTYKKTLSGSVGAGMGAVFNPKGRRYYILEHKVSSRYHKAGESQEIIVDQIELGRDPSCQVRFDEQFETVSRRHAAIVKDGDNWKLVQLSKTNTTFLNGHPIKDEWYLQNGDEIQLSVNGPKLGFIIPTGEKATTGSINFSHRLSLFRQQALRPYRIGLIVMGVLLLLALLVGGYFIYRGHKANEVLQEQLDQTEQELQEIKTKHKQEIDSLVIKYETIERDLRDAKKVASDPVQPARVSKNVKESEGVTDEQSQLVVSLLSNTYYMTVLSYKIVSKDGTEIEVSAGETYQIGEMNVTVPTVTGAGFLLNNGVFVTTRKTIEPWLFDNDEMFVLMNLMQAAGATIESRIYFATAAGDEFQYSSDYFTCNRSSDEVKKTEDGIEYIDATFDLNAYAYARLDMQGGFPYSKGHQLVEGEDLLLMGYPSQQSSNVEPDLGTATSTYDGLSNGYIVMQDVDIDDIASGSMVVAKDGNNIVAIGVLLGISKEKKMGLAIPLSALKF